MESSVLEYLVPEQFNSGRTLLEVTRDFFASSPRELPVSKGEIVKYMGKDRSWIRVKTTDGFVGFIPSRYVRPYDAKKIRQQRKQNYMQLKSKERSNTSSRRLDVSLRGSNGDKANANQLKDFINIAVSEALSNMSLKGTIDLSEHEEPLASSHCSELFKSHLQGVCGRSCRLCYSRNGLRKSDLNLSLDSNGTASRQSSLVEEDCPNDYLKISAITSRISSGDEVKKRSRRSGERSLKNSRSEKVIDDKTGTTLAVIQEDQSDSGICVTQADESTGSRCSCDLESCKSNISEEQSPNQVPPPSPLERFLGLDYNTLSANCQSAFVSPAREETASVSCMCSNFPGGSVLVLRNFLQDEEEDLTVWKGDVVTVVDDSERDWIWVRDKKGEEGYIPRAYASDDSCQECQSLLKKTLMDNKESTLQEESSTATIPDEAKYDEAYKTDRKGARFYVLRDHIQTNGSTISAKVGDVVIANMNEQLVDGWIWVYSSQKKVSGYLPEDILLEADPIEITEV